jgi:hypothetical protein
VSNSHRVIVVGMTTVFVLFTRQPRAGRTARDAVCHTRPSSGPEIVCEGVAEINRQGGHLDGLLFFRGVTPLSGAARVARLEGHALAARGRALNDHARLKEAGYTVMGARRTARRLCTGRYGGASRRGGGSSSLSYASL